MRVPTTEVVARLMSLKRRVLRTQRTLGVEASIQRWLTESETFSEQVSLQRQKPSRGFSRGLEGLI